MGEAASRLSEPDEPNERDEQDEPDLSEIRDEIRETRAEIGSTVDAIQERLDPQRLKEETIDAIEARTLSPVEHTIERVRRRARERPALFGALAVVVLVIVAGAALAEINRRRVALLEDV